MEIIAYKGRPFSVLVDEFLSHFALQKCHVVDMYIYQKSQKYNQQDVVCRLSLLFFFAEIRRCLFGAPCSRQIGSFVLYHRNPFTPTEKNRFWKTKILVTVFQMLKCVRTGNLYKHRQSLLELCRTCAESKKREVHTSLSPFLQNG